MLEFLLSYFTFVIAIILFAAFVAFLIKKKETLSPRHKIILFAMISLLIFYFIFIIILVFAFGSGVSHLPTPLLS